MSPPENVPDLASKFPPHRQMHLLLLLMHPPTRKNIKNRILPNEMRDHNPGNPIIVPLFFQLINMALGLVELGDQLEGCLIDVVGDFVFEEGLVEVEALGGVAGRCGRVLQHYSRED